VLVLHGAPGGYDQGLAIAEGLGLDAFQTIAVSRPGSLGTSLGSRLLPMQQAEDVAGLIEAQGWGKVAILAFSSGAPTALALAASHPDKVACVAIVSGIVAALPPSRPGDPPQFPEAVLSGLTGDVGAAAFDWLLENQPGRAMEVSVPAFQGGGDADRRALTAYLSANANGAAAFRAMARSVLPLSPREAGARNDLFQMRMLPAQPLPSAGLPVLFLHGTEDPLVPLSQVQAFAETIPGAKLVTVEKGGHLPWLNPDGPRGAAVLREFLESATGF
jgi:pimeloyl-ACP methyl ester carboxylesterase